jgi:hypothetical protein
MTLNPTHVRPAAGQAPTPPHRPLCHPRWRARTLLPLIFLLGCPEGPFALEQDEPEPEGPPMAAGASCAGTPDCPGEQICVEGACRYQRTSVAGEVLASAGAAQLEAGDFAGAVRTFDQAIDAYDNAEAPVPPPILCGAAIAALQEGSGTDARERAAKRADACLRGSLPGDAQREAVLAALTRLRYEGLDARLFDQPEPAGRFFTMEPSRPTVDAIDIRVELPDADDRGFDEVRQALQAEQARRAISDCFIQDWDLRHERNVSASLLLKVSSNMRDMGTYDIFVPSAEVAQTSLSQDGFEPCAAQALTDMLSDALPSNLGRRVSWQHPFEITARLQ